MRELSTHAKVAKLCRAFLKEKGIKGRCTSMSYAGGNSVDIYVTDVSPDVEKMLNEEFAKYEYGHFDGMTDSYEYDNWDDSIPQVKYLFVQVDYSDEMREAAARYLADEFGVKNNEDARRLQYWQDYAVLVRRVLNGDLGEFWKINGGKHAKVG